MLYLDATTMLYVFSFSMGAKCNFESFIHGTHFTCKSTEELLKKQ